MATQLPDGVRLLRTLTGHDGAIGRIGWSPDGRLLATPSDDGHGPHLGRRFRGMFAHHP